MDQVQPEWHKHTMITSIYWRKKSTAVITEENYACVVAIRYEIDAYILQRAQLQYFILEMYECLFYYGTIFPVTNLVDLRENFCVRYLKESPVALLKVNISEYFQFYW